MHYTWQNMVITDSGRNHQLITLKALRNRILTGSPDVSAPLITWGKSSLRRCGRHPSTVQSNLPWPTVGQPEHVLPSSRQEVREASIPRAGLLPDRFHANLIRRKQTKAEWGPSPRQPAWALKESQTKKRE